MFDYIIIFISGIYVGTYYDCKPVIFYITSFVKSAFPKIEERKDNLDQDEIEMSPISNSSEQTHELNKNPNISFFRRFFMYK